MINIQDLTKIYRSNKGDVIALNELNLHIPKNKFALIKGHSGCGKSTLLFTISGMLKPSSGKIEVLGKSPSQFAGSERNKFLSSQLGFVFQSYNLVPYLTVLENIMLPRKAGNKTINTQKAKQLARDLNIENRLKHYPSELSIGEKQRVALARAFIVEPQLILADEPTGNLDPDNTQEVLKHLEAYYKAGCSVVMVSHSNEADNLANITVYMEKGKISNIVTK